MGIAGITLVGVGFIWCDAKFNVEKAFTGSLFILAGFLFLIAALFGET